MCKINNRVTSEEMAKYFSESNSIDNAAISQLYTRAADDNTRAKLRRWGFIVNPYEDKAGRPLSFAERKVNLTSLEHTLDTVEEATTAEVTSIVNDHKAKIVAQITKALDEGVETLANMETIKTGGKLSKVYGRVAKEMFEVGKKTAADEIGVKTAITDPDVRGIYRAQAIQAELNIEVALTETAKTEAIHQISKGVDKASAIVSVGQAIDQKIARVVAGTMTQVITGSLNTGRMSTYQANKDKVYGYQFTAVLDGRTTNLCRSLNGRVVSKNDPDYYYFNPPLHYRCRSFWVAILMDEFIKPAIEAIPEYISRNQTGYTKFQDLQRVYEYKPLAAPTPEESRIQRDGVITDIIGRLQKAGANIQ